MEWTGLNDLREHFLRFFEEKSHTRLASFPLVPRDDASLLLINSGMAPMKKFFLGLATPPNKRVTTCQKCIRTPDIENVGKTARHGTYFEMLGNFSFGDYFKHEATAWAWEFLTKELQIPAEKLYISVFEDDDEAWDIWVKEVGIDPSHMVRFGREDNFWEIGSGPCGPCSEIYFDRGPDKGCGKPDCRVGCDCDRFMEVWNLVFSQFDSDGNGTYTPMAHPNIDTGMGLERLACVMQGVDNLFEVDTVQNIMKHISRIAGVTYHDDPHKDISLRVITDHVRSTTMMIGDGVVPQNEGRGYVLRRLLRRAARHGRLLGIREPFLYQVADTVIGENKNAYPELVQNRDYIVKVIRMEEERFAKTIDAGLEQVGEIIDGLTQKGETVFPGADAFRLYDTCGFPIDLTKEICSERGLTVDEAGYQANMEEQRTRAREARKAMGDLGWTEDALKDQDFTTSFVGYDSLESQAVILALVAGGELADTIGDGEEATVVLDKTPFYAEMGGQVGDTGVIRSGSSVFEVTDCHKSPTGHFVHMGRITQGVLSAGDKVEAVVDRERRASIMRNHSSCHLLQAALQKVLGSHVHQAGSYVDDKICRFDFSHFSAMTDEEIQKTQRLVNEMILEANPVTATEMPLEEAQKLGAMALFGEKYGDTVRVVDMNKRSIEFCGGTHVDNTAKLGLFRILKESSVAAGIRRIEATTGWGVLDYMEETTGVLNAAAQTLKLGSPSELVEKVAQMTAELKAKDKKLAEGEQKLAALEVDGLLAGAKEVGSVRLLRAAFKDKKPDALRTICDAVRSKEPKAVAVLSSVTDGKGTICVACGPEAVAAGAVAGKLVKALCALTGGSGGGRPDSAMGSAKDVSKLEEALAQAEEVLLSLVTK